MTVPTDPSHLHALTSTFGLLARPIDSAWPYQDKAFALMIPAWSQNGKILVLDYSSRTPTALMDNSLADELKATGHNVHALQRLRAGTEQPRHGEWLVSGGLLLSNPQGELITFERTATSPSGAVIAWPKAINNPMGRIDTLPSATCYKEGAEEISILQIARDPAGTVTGITPQMFTFGDAARTGISLETELTLQEKMTAALARNGTPAETLLAATGFRHTIHDTRYDDRMTRVIVRENGMVRDTFRAVAIPSPAERTIEMAIPLMLTGAANEELRYVAREPFGRAIKMVTPLEMEAIHYGWAKGMFGSIHDPQQNRDVNLGGILPILQGAVLGMRKGVSRPEEVQVPASWPESRIKDTLKL